LAQQISVDVLDHLQAARDLERDERVTPTRSTRPWTRSRSASRAAAPESVSITWKRTL